MTTDALTRQELLALAIRMQEEERCFSEGPAGLSEKEGGGVCQTAQINLEKLSTSAIRAKLLENLTAQSSEVLH